MVPKPGIAIYGSVEIKRVFCYKCKSMALVIEGIKQCCGDEDNSFPEITYKMSGSRGIKLHYVRKKIIKEQNNTCPYCDKQFGYFYLRKGKTIKSTIHIDHKIPFSFSQDNKKENCIACCSLCNSLKSDIIFDTFDELKEYLNEKRKNKGIKVLS